MSLPLLTENNWHTPHLQEDYGCLSVGLYWCRLGWWCQQSLIDLRVHFHYGWSSHQLVIKEANSCCPFQHRSRIHGHHCHCKGNHLATDLVFRNWAITYTHAHQATNWQSVGNVSCKECHFPWMDETHHDLSSLHQGEGGWESDDFGVSPNCKAGHWCFYKAPQLSKACLLCRRYGFDYNYLKGLSHWVSVLKFSIPFFLFSMDTSSIPYIIMDTAYSMFYLLSCTSVFVCTEVLSLFDSCLGWAFIC